MTDVNAWNVAASSNNAAPPDGWPENMAYSAVNNSARENMAGISRWHKDTNGSLVGAGTVNAYTVTLNQSYAAYFIGLCFACSINITNTGTASLNVNGIGARTIVNDQTGAVLTAGALVAGQIYSFRYDGASLRVLGQFNASLTLTGDVTGSGASPIATTIAPNAVTLAKMATLTTDTILGRDTAGVGNVEALSGSQVLTIVGGAAATRQVIAGAGMTGGGDLTADRTLNVIATAGGGLIVNADDVQVDRASLTPTTAVGYLDVPQNPQPANYTLVIGDRGKHLLHALGDGAGDVYTIPANASVAYPTGTTISFVNMDTNTISIAITTDTMRLAGVGTTGARTLGQYGIATALKTAATEWLISGTNLT